MIHTIPFSDCIERWAGNWEGEGGGNTEEEDEEDEEVDNEGFESGFPVEEGADYEEEGEFAGG